MASTNQIVNILAAILILFTGIFGMIMCFVQGVGLHVHANVQNQEGWCTFLLAVIVLIYGVQIFASVFLKQHFTVVGFHSLGVTWTLIGVAMLGLAGLVGFVCGIVVICLGVFVLISGASGRGDYSQV